MHAMSSHAHTLRTLALALPHTYEDAPWGFPVFKVGNNKMFACMFEAADCVQVTVKLTADERQVVDLLSWVRPARYLGRYGWITADVTDDATLAAALEWVRESYWLKAPAAYRDAAFEPYPSPPR
jgi:predicted DNA-binding protein (MmcQ/YjbR family)